MSFRDLIPFGHRQTLPGVRSTQDPFADFQKEMDRLLQDFWQGNTLPSQFRANKAAIQMPQIEVSETDEAYLVEADLPGLTEDEVDVNLADGLLTIRGEKKLEEDKKEKGVQYTERSYGMFRRTLQVPTDVKEEDIKAEFKNGVLHLELPKSAEKNQNSRRIEIKKGS